MIKAHNVAHSRSPFTFYQRPDGDPCATTIEARSALLIAGGEGTYCLSVLAARRSPGGLIGGVLGNASTVLPRVRPVSFGGVLLDLRLFLTAW